MASDNKRRKVLILGAAGRDFHHFNVRYRDNPNYEVIAFTATQIPDIDGRMYPPELSGPLYPAGIPIKEEDDMEDIIKEFGIEQVDFAYSDVHHVDVMHLGSRASAAGADFCIPDTIPELIPSVHPCVAITATRTGCGKSQATRAVATILRDQGYKLGIARHPMPYGDLAKQAVQRFASYDDFATHECTIEEREEYEPYVEAGHVIYAGVDYEAILRSLEKESDVTIWDGGNNDAPFFKPDLWICITDPHRVGHGAAYHPGEINLRSADLIIINKTDSASPEQIAEAEKVAKKMNPTAEILKATSPITVNEDITGKRVLAVEDGPTATHGGMKFGAGYLAAKRCGAGEIVDPRPHLVGSLAATFEKYNHIEEILPAMGYGEQQVADLEATINAIDCDVVVAGTPIDLSRLINVNKPVVRAKYDLDDETSQKVAEIIKTKLQI